MVTLASSSITLNVNVGGGTTIQWTKHVDRWTNPVDMGLAGVYWLTPYDMENDFGSAGQTIAAANDRYLWLVSSDHHGDNDGAVISNWAGGGGIWRGFSSDPAVLPTTWVQIIGYKAFTATDPTGHLQMETPWLVYNPDDATYPFYMYGHGNLTSGARGQETLLFRSADMESFLTPVVSHLTTSALSHTGYQGVVRRGTGDWISMGSGRVALNDQTKGGFFTSTDGQTFTRQDPQEVNIDGEDFTWRAWTVTVDGQFYNLGRRNTAPKDQVLLFPFNASTYQPTGASPLPISERYGGNFPDLTTIQGFSGYVEDGVFLYYVSRGYYANFGDAQIDLHSLIADETAAASAAPFGVTASCTDGAVTVSWLNALPHQNYRVARSASASGPWTDLQDVTGISYVDNSPTADAVNYYRVTTLNGGEQGSRIVSTYAGNYSATTNAHITRALAAGAENVDAAWVEAVVDWLVANSLTDNLEHWVSPAFGVTFSSGVIIDYVMDLARTLVPTRIADARANDTNWTYSATGMSGSVPGAVAGATQDGIALSKERHNPLRIRNGGAITVLMAYNRDATNNATFHPFAWYNFRGLKFDHDISNSKIVATQTHDDGTAWTAEIAVDNAADLVAGFTVDAGGGLTAWAQGVAGTPTASGSLDIDNQIMFGAGGTNLQPAIGVDRFVYTEETTTFAGTDGPKFAWSDCMVFNVALTSGQMSSLNTLLQNRFAA